MCSLWLDERILPSYIATASLFILLVRGVWVSRPVRILRGVNTDHKLLELERGKHEQKHGIVIAAFKVARLAGVLVLLGVSAVTAINYGLKWLDLALVGTLVRLLFKFTIFAWIYKGEMPSTSYMARYLPFAMYSPLLAIASYSLCTCL